MEPVSVSSPSFLSALCSWRRNLSTASIEVFGDVKTVMHNLCLRHVLSGAVGNVHRQRFHVALLLSRQRAPQEVSRRLIVPTRYLQYPRSICVCQYRDVIMAPFRALLIHPQTFLLFHLKCSSYTTPSHTLNSLKNQKLMDELEGAGASTGSFFVFKDSYKLF